MFDSPIATGIALLGLVACCLAFFKGGPAERSGAAIILANFLLLRLADMIAPSGSTAIIELVIDGLTALGLLVVALRYGSLWLGFVMLFYAAQFTLHSFYLVTERPQDNLHAILNNSNWVGVSLCLILGTATSWRRRAKTAAT